jgi:glycosyltransferase involved in cell wall biosynthesis
MGVSKDKPNLCMAAKVPGVAGPANFQRRLAEGLVKRGWDISYGLTELNCGAILVIGGSREFRKLREARSLGIPIIQRLNGMNWIHRQARTGALHFLRAELNNIILRLIRDRFAGWIVYQSEFAQRWWEDKYGIARVGKSVILNGAPLDLYSPDDEGDRSSDQLRLLMVEGNLSGGYEVGLETGIRLAMALSDRFERELELVVVGNVPEPLKRALTIDHSLEIEWVGQLPSDSVPNYYRTADLFFAGDPNPACPNAVIEALACGLPVVAFNTGAIQEIISNDAGRIAPYGGDVWKLDPPDIEGLAIAAGEVLERLPTFRVGARRRAVEAFDVEDMVDRYVSVFGRTQDEGRG